jgi:hypothetical protein
MPSSRVYPTTNHNMLVARPAQTGGGWGGRRQLYHLVQNLKHFLLIRAFRKEIKTLSSANEKNVSRANAVFTFRFGGVTNSWTMGCSSIMNVVTRRFHIAHCFKRYGDDTVSRFAALLLTLLILLPLDLSLTPTPPLLSPLPTPLLPQSLLLYLLAPHFYSTQSEIHLNK